MWTYNQKEIKELSDFPEDTYGFIYKITHIPSGKKYIGKKVLFFERNVALSKKQLEELKEQRKQEGKKGKTPTKAKTIKESDWKTYHGSQKEIKELVQHSNPSDIVKEILEVVPSKKLLTYFETKYLFMEGVVENQNEYINDNILGKFFRKDFIV